MRPVFIGEALGKLADRNKVGVPLFPVPEGCAGHRLMELCGMGRAEYLQAADRVNLLPVSPWRETGDVFAWSADAARGAALTLLRVLPGRRAVLLGQRVRVAFGGIAEPMVWHKRREAGMAEPALLAFLPHPSGRNRWYNDPTNAEAARKFLREEVFLFTSA